MYTMKHSWSIEEQHRFLETHRAVGVNAMGEILYAPKQEEEAEQNEVPAPPLTSEELEAVEELKASGTLYSENDVEPW